MTVMDHDSSGCIDACEWECLMGCADIYEWDISPMTTHEAFEEFDLDDHRYECCLGKEELYTGV